MIGTNRVRWMAPLLAALLVSVVAIPAAAAETLSVTTDTLAGGELGLSYSRSLSATGGVEPYSWSVSDGALPAGLTLNASTGAIAGTPTAAGSFEFVAKVTDSTAVEAMTATQVFTIVIAEPVSVATTELPKGTLEGAYSRALRAVDGVEPYAWSLLAGTLPDGLALSDAGVIEGVATAIGTFAFTVQVEDALGGTATAELSITVEVAGELAITTSELPKGSAGAEYSTTLMATGGVAPLTWSIVAGSLPDGLSLDKATGVIAGTPAQKGTSLFAIVVTDAAGHTDGEIFFLNVAKEKKPARELNEKVLATCNNAVDASPALSALCRIYSTEQVGSPALHVIGKVILKIADRDAEAKQDRKDERREAKDDARASKDEAKRHREDAKKHNEDVTEVRFSGKDRGGQSSHSHDD